MIYLQLFLSFLWVGCFSFGGAYSAIPLIRDAVLSRGWLAEEELSYMIAVSESTPGPIMVNLATYVGSSQGGVPGAFLATFAVVLPAFLIMILVATVLSKLLDRPIVKSVIETLTPCVIGLIFATGISVSWNNCLPAEEAFSLRPVLIALGLAILYFGSRPILKKLKVKKKISPILLLLIAAAVGMVFAP